MKKSFLIIPLLLSTVGVTQQPPKVPVITDAQKIAYFKASSEFLAAQSAAQNANQLAQQKQTALQETVKVIAAVCGKEYSPTMDAAGEPVCAANPVAPKTGGK